VTLNPRTPLALVRSMQTSRTLQSSDSTTPLPPLRPARPRRVPSDVARQWLIRVPELESVAAWMGRPGRGQR
jgi:hypothetical protein